MSSALRGVLLVVAVVVIGGAAGMVWERLAEPGDWTVAGGALGMGEEASRGDFQVVLTFVLVSACAAVLWGVVTAVLLRPDWGVPFLAGLGAVVAGLIAWKVGVALGPSDPTRATGLSDGDTVPAMLAVTSPVPFFAWPIGAMVGVLLGTWTRPARGEAQPQSAMDAWTASVNDTRS